MIRPSDRAVPVLAVREGDLAAATAEVGGDLQLGQVTFCFSGATTPSYDGTPCKSDICTECDCACV
jgi:hypothetical protein